MESHAATSPNTEPATKTHPSLLFQFFVISTLLCMVNALRNSEVSWQNFLWLYISIYVNVWMLWKHAHSQCIQFGYSGQSLGILHRQAAAKPCTSAVLEQGQRWRPPLWAPLGELPSFLIVPDRTEAHGRLQVEQWQPASSTTLTECIPYKLQVTIMTITKADLLPWKCSESLDHMLIINDMSIMVYLSKCDILLIHLYTWHLKRHLYLSSSHWRWWRWAEWWQIGLWPRCEAMNYLRNMFFMFFSLSKSYNYNCYVMFAL